MTDLYAAQKAIAAHYATHLEIDVDEYMPATPQAGQAFVWPGEDWIQPDEDGNTFCAEHRVSWSIEVYASLTDSFWSQEWLAGIVSKALDAPPCEVGNDTCTVASVPRLRLVTAENNQKWLNASIRLTPLIT